MLKLDWCNRRAAKYAVEHWHYSQKMPSGKLTCIGVWEDDSFIGAVMFGRGANNHIGTRYGLKQTEVCELVRIALREHTTPVSRIVSIAIKILRKQSPGLKLIVSYADPVQGHKGGIYQAGNWTYAGISTPQAELIVDGKKMHKRSAGAKWGTASPERLRKITGKQVLYDAVRWKHTYLMPLTNDVLQKILKLSKPYPKRADEVKPSTRSTSVE